MKRSKWKMLRSSLQEQSKPDLLSLVKDLYELRRENRTFLEVRFLSDQDSMEALRRRIAEALSPDPFSSRDLSLRAGREAIRDYRRAVGDPQGMVDLMLLYVESGTEYSSDLGYGNGPFFDSLESMFTAALKELFKLDESEREGPLARVHRILDLAKNLGWGYGDALEAALLQSPFGGSS